MIQWDDFRYFIEVARAGTVSAAAKNMGVSHATALRHIEQLEKGLQSRLFDHLQSGYRMTPVAERIISSAFDIEASIQNLQRQIKGLETSQSSQLSLSFPDSALLNLTPILHRFSRQHPNVELSLVSDTSLSGKSKLQADVVIQVTNHPTEQLVGRKITQLTFGYYASRKYLKSRPAKQRSDIASDSHRWIIWSGRETGTIDESLNQQESWLHFIATAPDIVLRSNNYNDILLATRDGMGIGLLTHREAEQYPELVCLPYKSRAGSLSVWLLTHSELRYAKLITSFMRFVYESI